MRVSESMRALYERAAIIPGRSMTRSKAPGLMFDVGRGPLYATGGHGCRLRSDGDAYIDMVCALGAVSLGYGRGETWDALTTALDGASLLSLPHELEVEVAERVIEAVAPWATSVRFTKTGSESTHAAYLIAKAATGRRHVMVGDWAYHGWHEWCWFKGESRHSDSGTAHRFAHGADPNQFCAEAGLVPGSIAAIFVEPHRWERVDVAWLRDLREWCNQSGALLVFDEMIYGARWALGGATECFGVEPDLACYGKGFGNGQPIAFVVGRGALDAHGDRASGTYSGDALALSAMLSVIDCYTEEPVIASLWERGRQLKSGLERVREMSPWPVRVEGEPVHQRLRFLGDESAHRGRAFAARMADHGVLWHPSVVNIMYAHTRTDIDIVIDAALASIEGIDRWNV